MSLNRGFRQATNQAGQWVVPMGDVMVRYPAEAGALVKDGIMYAERLPDVGGPRGCANCRGWGYVYARRIGESSHTIVFDEGTDRKVYGDLVSYRCPECGGKGTR